LTLIWGTVAVKVAAERVAAVDAVIRENSNLSRALQEHTSRTVNAVDQVLLDVKLAYERNGRAPDPQALLRISVIAARSSTW